MLSTLDMLIFSLKVQRWIEAKNVLQKVIYLRKVNYTLYNYTLYKSTWNHLCQNCESRTYKCLFDKEKNARKYIVCRSFKQNKIT